MLEQMHFEREDFSQQDLAGQIYRHCRFILCDFSRANLTDTQFIDCSFIASGDSQGCDFAYAQLKD
ncbi:pentapeptide repeat-containing protein, partial [Photobacterium damselae]